MSEPKLICLLGAESTGKTSLAQALASDLSCPWVREYLREFCDANGRTPRKDEQRDILEAQRSAEALAHRAAIERSAAYVICDTAPMLTAIYSEYVFNDCSLYEIAIEHHRRYALTLLLAPDLPWVADGIQRSGDNVRAPIHEMIRRTLTEHALPHKIIRGSGNERTLAAINAIARLRGGPADVPRGQSTQRTNKA